MEYTIEITTHCPHCCDFCSTSAGPQGKPLAVEHILEFLRCRTITGGDRINISGGEPLSHPDFWDILQACYALTDDVWIYTNAIRQLRYNAAVLDEITVDANVCLVPGRSVYIPRKADCVHLLQLVRHGRAQTMSPVRLHLSGNATRDASACQECKHVVLQADGQIILGPCRKQYGEAGKEKPRRGGRGRGGSNSKVPVTRPGSYRVSAF